MANMRNNNIEAGAQKINSVLSTSRQITTKNTLVFDITIYNKGSGTFWAQIWDVPDVTNVEGAGYPARAEEEIEIAAGSYAPFSWMGGKQFNHGIYIRAVTALSGGTLIGGADMTVTGRMHSPWPIST